jgi:hypothetical protein
MVMVYNSLYTLIQKPKGRLWCLVMKAWSPAGRTILGGSGDGFYLEEVGNREHTGKVYTWSPVHSPLSASCPP